MTTDTACGLDRDFLDDLAATLDGTWSPLSEVELPDPDTDLDALGNDLNELGLIECPQCEVWLYLETANDFGQCEDCA